MMAIRYVLTNELSRAPIAEPGFLSAADPVALLADAVVPLVWLVRAALVPVPAALELVEFVAKLALFPPEGTAAPTKIPSTLTSSDPESSAF